MRKRRRPTSWLLGVAGSAVLHASALIALFAFDRPDRRALAADGDPVSDAIALTTVEAVFASPDLLAAAIPVDVAPPTRAWDAPESDRDNLVTLSTGPSDSDGRRRAVPAPDRGEAGGHPPDHAYRLDESTLRSRLTDGATESQPARTRTAGRAASPQAIRREPVVGIGDSVRNQTPRRAPSPSPMSSVALGGPYGAAPAGTTAEAAASAEAPLPVPSAELAALASPARATGPLDVEQGTRSFDTERPGKASDDDSLRAASNESHPGLTDFTRPAAPATTAARENEGRGSALHAGAVSRPTSGTAPSELGVPDRQAAAAEANERARARGYERCRQEIRQRVKRVLEFPKPLALRMEQGVTVVYFVVGADGRLAEGPRVVKSSGFDEFDSAAVRAVRHAAPFPAMPFAVSLSMEVIFDNPVIR
jgi:TonB family protein